ncbi:MAG: hypothetical protein H5T86_14225 [Armatimonadetes bacterium]|nr:hypothetical protein [Armatimonadota bacterium]
MLVFSVLAAFAHFLILWLTKRYVAGQADAVFVAVHTGISVAAVVLPPLAAAVTSIAGTLEYGRRGRVCEAYAVSLRNIERQLSDLIERVASSDGLTRDDVLAFKRLVMETEEKLSRELFLWVALMSQGSLPVHI